MRGQEIVSGSFTYDLLTEDQAVSAKADAAWVRERYASLEASTLEATVEIGQRLVAARESIGHGHFLQWVESEFDFGRRVAQNMMQVADRFGSNTQRVAHLPQRSVYLLAAPSTPEAIREEVLAKPAEEAPSFDQLRELVREAKACEAKQRQRAKMPEQKRKRVERNETAKAREEERWREEQRQQKEAADAAVKLLVDALGDRAQEVMSVLITIGSHRLRDAICAYEF